jgi:drug/metabolite transporter (DMT)-like permease
VTLTSFALIVLAALMHATWNLAAKKAQGGQIFVALCSLFSISIYALPIAFVVARYGLPRGNSAWLAIAASGAIHLAYFSILQKGYREADLSVVYPVARGTGPLVSILAAVSLLGERPSLQAWAGALVVIVGVFLLAGGAALVRSRDTRARAGLYWGSLTGLSIAAYTVLDGYAVRWLAVSPLLLDYAGHLLRVGLSTPYLVWRRGELYAECRRTWRYALVIATIGPLGYLLVLLAMQSTPISYVAPARELSMLVGAFFGAHLLDEGEVKRRLACAAVIAVGVLLIALG